MSLAGKRVLITGGGSGVGADLAHGFAGAGAEAIIAGRRLDALLSVAETHPRIRALRADITREEEVKQLFQSAGPIDIVIANAGVAGSAPLARTTLEQWQEMLCVNLTGVFLTFREGVGQMSGWGRLIAIASLAALKGYAYAAPYAATKHGVVGLTKSLALEVASRPITVNAICPGFLDTDMTARSLATIQQKTGRSREQALETLVARNPQKRLIAPAAVTATALWLCQPGTDSITGQAIALSGGEC